MHQKRKCSHCLNKMHLFVLLIAKIYIANLSSTVLSSPTGTGPPESTKIDNELNLLKQMFVQFSTSYPPYTELKDRLKLLQATFPENVEIYSIGLSVQLRELLVIHIAKNVTERESLVPMVKIVANMHGDETLGRALTIMLAVKLLQGYRENNPRIMNIIESIDLHIMPSMNPDGFEASKEGICNPNPRAVGRRNAHNIDLNRNFPDQFHETPGKTLEELSVGRQPETIFLMKWIVNQPFVLSANFHTGALVVSYPFDSLPDRFQENQRGVKSVSPDDKIFEYLSRLYADSHLTIHQDSETCLGEEFDRGVTNGAEWFNVQGGMQDFNYVHSNCLEITMELSCCKYPSSNTLLKEWENNEEALLKYLEASQLGIKGYVFDENGEPINQSQIIVDGIDHNILSTERGEYWRLLVPGEYNISASHEKYQPASKKLITLTDANSPMLVNFTMTVGVGVQFTSRSGESGKESTSSSLGLAGSKCLTFYFFSFSHIIRTTILSVMLVLVHL